MIPPTTEEEAISEEVLDDGWKRHLDGRDPFYIQTILDALCRRVNSMEESLQNNLEVYIAEAIDQVMHIRALEYGITNNNPLVLAEIAEARRTYVEEKAVFDEIMDSDKEQIDLKKRQIAVLKHTLLLALYGIHAPIFTTT
jgi:hypothetical protein